MGFAADGYRGCSVVIQHSLVDSTLTDFPVMLTEDTLPSEMFDADGSFPALSDGGDIRFSSDNVGNSQIPCEIEYWVTDNNPANGKAVIWVKIASLSSSANTTIYVWYNKVGQSQPGRATTYGLENVWNSNYKCVLHMNQTPSGAASILDSTSNTNHFTSYNMDGTNLVDSKYGKCLKFNGTDECLRISDNTTLDISTNITLQGVFNTTNRNNQWGTIVAKDRDAIDTNVNYRMAFNDTTGKIAWYHNDGEWRNRERTAVLANGTWYKVDLTKAGSSTPALYTNNDATGCTGGDTTALTTDNNSVLVGATRVYSTQVHTDFFVGRIERVRIVDTNFSVDWVDAEYNNWNNPGTFAIEGTPFSSNTYTVSGIVRVEDQLKARKVYIYNQSTGALLGTTTASIDGVFSVTTSGGTCYAVVVPNDVAIGGDLVSSLDPIVT